MVSRSVLISLSTAASIERARVSAASIDARSPASSPSLRTWASASKAIYPDRLAWQTMCARALHALLPARGSQPTVPDRNQRRQSRLAATKASSARDWSGSTSRRAIRACLRRSSACASAVRSSAGSSSRSRTLEAGRVTCFDFLSEFRQALWSNEGQPVSQSPQVSIGQLCPCPACLALQKGYRRPWTQEGRFLPLLPAPVGCRSDQGGWNAR